MWFTPTLGVEYRPRSGTRPLASQFFRTGQWRREVIRRYPQTASARYLAPPVMVSLVAAGLLLGAVGVATGSGLAWAMAAPVTYLVGVVVASVPAGARLGWRARALLPGVLVVMHVAWGVGFLVPLRAR